MSIGQSTVGAAIGVIVLVALAGCASAPVAHDAASIDAQYGIPANSVPADMLQPDGSMNNGLLPAQPYDTGG